jgi:hypothetical protein
VQLDTCSVPHAYRRNATRRDGGLESEDGDASGRESETSRRGTSDRTTERRCRTPTATGEQGHRLSSDAITPMEGPRPDRRREPCELRYLRAGSTGDDGRNGRQQVLVVERLIDVSLKASRLRALMIRGAGQA